jgi:hypothetical protein
MNWNNEARLNVRSQNSERGKTDALWTAMLPKISLTNTNPWSFSKRQISEVRPLVLHFLAEAIWFEFLRARVIFLILVEANYRNDN